MDTVNKKLTRWDLGVVFLRLLFLQGLLHPKGMQNLGIMHALAPALARIGLGGGNKPMLENHFKFFNCNPNLAPLVVGGVLRLEEERLAGGAVTVEDIDHFKRAISSPLAAMGDLLFLGTFKPLALTLACIFAIYNSFIGLIVVWLLYNVVVVTCRLWGVYFGYARGWELVDVFSGPAFQRLLGIVQSVGASAGGALVAVVLFRLAERETGMLLAGIGLSLAAIWLLRRDASSSRVAILLFPLSLLIARVIG